ncbi:MAG: DUF58 domain-containing protein [Acholeplasma sp.]
MKRKILNDEFIGRLETLTFHMSAPMRGFFGGNHRTNTYGSTVEFADFREYVLGDDIRHIDWNLYSRFEKHYIKLFVDERQMCTQIFIDCSASMAKIDFSKAAYALKAAAAIGYISVHNMDRVSLRLIKGENLEEIDGTITGKTAFYRAISKLEDTTFKGYADIEKAVMNGLNIGSNDGLTVIISDFLTENNWKKAVDYLIYQKRQVLLLQVLSEDELNPHYSGRIRLVDSEAKDPLDERNLRMKITKSDFKAYHQALSDYQAEIKKFCNARGAHFVSVSSKDTVERLVFEKLAQVGTVK